MQEPSLLFAFGLTLLAGLATGVGSLLAYFTGRTNTRFFSLALGASGGVMIYISFLEILPEAQQKLTSALGQGPGSWAATAAFFAGILLIAVIDRLVPETGNPHEVRRIESCTDCKDGGDRMLRMGLFTALTIAVHNFPEGLAAFISAMQDTSVGIAVAIAIAIHNIPEGIAVFVPVYLATGSRRKAFLLSFLSGLSEPLGALVGYFFLLPFYNDVVSGSIFALVAGIMVFISLDELLPTAREYGEAHLAIYGVIAGMLVMAVSLLLLT
ncbi:MAG TPA: zinc transporter ZupT [Firmicutes bacterium]|nr:zinc transporter ZupT [Bacillota bacterium]